MKTFTLADEERLMRKLRWKVIPYIFILYIISMIDRTNIGIASLTMNDDIGISASTYGLMAGLFFISYFFCEVPSNVIMYKVGARKWIARIMITWGIVVFFEGFIQNATQLGILRFLLGVAEAGFYPGIILYLTYWFPAKHQGRAISMFMVGMAVSNIVGGPLSALIMDNVQWFGIAGWRWVFILEAIPAFVLGFATLRILVDRPEQAKFLTKDEKNWLSAELQKEHEEKLAKVNISKWAVFKDGLVWRMVFAYLGYIVALYGLGFWLPQIIKGLSTDLSTTQIGFISVIPYIVGAIAMVIVARHSDKTNERRYHVALPILVAFIALILVTFTDNLYLSLALISISTAGIYSFVGTFWTIPNLVLGSATAAVGIAFINSFGNLGGFVGPYMVGWFTDLTGSNRYGMYMLAFFALLATILILSIPKKLVTQESVGKSDIYENRKDSI